MDEKQVRAIAIRRARIAVLELQEAERRGLPARVLQLMRRTVGREMDIAEGVEGSDGVVERAVCYGK